MTTMESTTQGAIRFKPEVTCAINVTDFARSSAWYQEVLGFQQLYTVDEVGWGEFQSPIPGVTIGLSQVEPGTAAGGPGGATLTWGVEDIAAVRAALEAKGVQFDGETRTLPGLVMLATFFDPDGNAMMLAQSLMQQ